MAESKTPAKIKLGDYQIPFGEFIWPALVEPDTRWKPEGEYTTRIKYDGSTAESIRAKLLEFQKKAEAEYRSKIEDKRILKALKLADLPLKAEEDEEGEPTGNYLLKVKRKASGVTKAGKEWKATIPIADASGRLVKTKGLTIWSGTEGRVKCEVFGWYSAKDKEIGITLQIAGVQIKKLVTGSGRDPKFDAIEDGGWTQDEDDINDNETDAETGDGEDAEDADF